MSPKQLSSGTESLGKVSASCCQYSKMTELNKFFCVLILGTCFVFTYSRNVKSMHKPSSDRSCRLADLQLQKNFDLKRFQGKWYGTFKTSMGDSLLSYFTEIYDPRIIFKLNTDGSFDLRAYGSKFYGGWCPKGKGHAKMPSPGEPEKMTMYFDTRIGRQIGMKPGWILKTDYISYAIIYSCWKENSDGTCVSDNAYVGVIQRKPQPLKQSKRTEINNALKRACVDPNRLAEVTHYGYCPDRDVDL